MKTNKKLINPKIIGRNIVLGLGAFAAVLALAVLASCDNEPKLPTCTCNPKYHGSEDGDINLCCGIGACETFTGKVMANGTKIILESSVSVTATAAEAKVNAALTYLTTEAGADYTEYVNNNIKIIRIIHGSSSINIIKESGKWIAVITDSAINSPSSNGLIGDKLYEFVELNRVAALFKQMDNSKNTVRMAFGKVMGQRMI